jgi:hypothetical protein
MIRLLLVVAVGYAAYRLLRNQENEPMALLPPPPRRRRDRLAARQFGATTVPSEAG